MLADDFDTSAACKFKVGDKVELLPLAKEIFKLEDIRYKISSGMVRKIEYEEDVGVLIHISRKGIYEKFHQDFLKKQVGWCSGFSVTKSEYDELARSQAEAACYIKDRLNRGRNLGRVK